MGLSVDLTTVLSPKPGRARVGPAPQGWQEWHDPDQGTGLQGGGGEEDF